eukprot:CAMPEP_0169063294 /NCGR_PEP_ID=MMETSP1015-20121227/1204_1 /TAXON_ID=342587 /ORGANISM="Karlodinium micrum, Strain CCMP2283" /LENGTH=214 /DNA_ID=CAMNT_0009121613 /DNA_START=248 /DNA_END=892 /DNA_ORIENTATION=-
MNLKYFESRKCKNKKQNQCMDPEIGCKIPAKKTYQEFCQGLLTQTQSVCESVGESLGSEVVSAGAHEPSEWRVTKIIDIRAKKFGGPPESKTPPGLRIQKGDGSHLGDVYVDESAIAQVCKSKDIASKTMQLQKLRALAAGGLGGVGNWEAAGVASSDISHERFEFVQTLLEASSSNPARHYQLIQDQLTQWEEQDIAEVTRTFRTEQPALFAL